jgi:hypothetical protein
MSLIVLVTIYPELLKFVDSEDRPPNRQIGRGAGVANRDAARGAWEEVATLRPDAPRRSALPCAKSSRIEILSPPSTIAMLLQVSDFEVAATPAQSQQ